DEEKDVGLKSDSFCKRTSNERRCDYREFQLKKGKQYQRNGSPCRSVENVIEHKVGHGASNESSDGISKGKAETDNDPEDADYAHGNEALKHRRNDVLHIDHTAIEEGKAGSHEHNECGSGEHPGNIARVDAFGVNLAGDAREKDCQDAYRNQQDEEE